MRRAFGYTRISRADSRKPQDEQEASLRQQREAIARYCVEEGLDLIHVYQDFAKSGATEEREDYRAALAALDAGEADVLVVRHLDRLSREADVLLALLSGERRWTLTATQQSVDTSTASGWFAASMFAVQAEFERRLLSERTRGALAQKRREGIVGGPKAGVDPAVEDRAAALLASGMSASAVARLFTAEGVSKGDRATSPTWDHSHVLAAQRRAELRAIRQARAS